MKAAVHEKYGPPSVLSIKELATPAPKENEVLVQVHAATVNRTDCARLSAKPFIMRFFTGLFSPKNPIPGTDFAGKIAAVGSGVSALKVGDDVFGFDDKGLSSHAQFLTIAQDDAMTTMPENASYEKAASSLEGVHYAYNFINKVALVPGQKVLVNGASGAIGSAMVQLLKHFDANVTAVCNTKNIELIKSIGAQTVIDYTAVDFTSFDERYHFVFDAVGKSSFAKCKPLLEPGGIYISSELGRMSQNIFLALFTPLFGGKKVIFPIPTDPKNSVLFIKKLIANGRFDAVIDRQYALEEISAAFEYVETGQKTGNVVLSIE